MRRLIPVMLAVLAALAVFGAPASAYTDPYLQRQEAAHAVAETARQYGYAEDSAVIQAAQADWWEAQAEFEAELDLLTRVVWFEAGSSWISDRQQQMVACVVLNRVEDPRFPGTIADVVYAPGQYSCARRLYSVDRYTIPTRCEKNAQAALYGLVECPPSVVWQAGFRQGRGVYAHMGNTYFCY